MANTEATIRIVKKKSGGHGHHGGAWKVAYADFVTAMMAFFLVMWILGLSKPQRQAIASFFLGQGTAVDIRKGLNAPIMPQDAGKGSENPSLQHLLDAVKDSLVNEISSIPELKDLTSSIEMQVTKEGLRIELIETRSSLFFDSGSANLKGHSNLLLQTIAKRLKTVQNPIVIEGHTDSHPLGRSGVYSNWELSADRANAARRAMEGAGMASSQIASVRGYADRKLKLKSDPFHFSNRRVSILVSAKDLDSIQGETSTPKKPFQGIFDDKAKAHSTE
ncbi:MAG: OmpA family protein [Armatimonadetes bacterium]|nr:OmpA family protein [Armatimonadota bacterium]